MYDVIIKNARIPQGDDTHKTNILIQDEKVAGFIDNLDGIEGKEIIDAEGHLTIPGCIDSHTHIMDPGFTHRENFFTGTSAAASGGITTIIDMPCCSKPSVRSVEQLHNKIDKIKEKAMVDFASWGGVTGEDVREGWLHNVQEQVDAGVVAFKVYMTPSVPTYPKVSDPEMLECFRAVAKTGLAVGIHAENFDICDFYVKKFEKEGRTDGPAWSEARMALAEKAAIELCLSFSEDTGCRMHIVHMSTGIGGLLVGEAKKRGLDVTAEVCPHYLTLNAPEHMGEFRQFAKIAPPLRTKKDNQVMWDCLADGRIDFVATDHAPYEIATEKPDDIWHSFPGIPGVETMAPVIVSEGYNKGRLPLSRLVEVLSEFPAKHYGLYPKKGSMFIGADADFTIFDLEKEWTIKKDKMVTMAKYSPFHGYKLKGKPFKTIVRGKVVYDDKDGLVGTQGYGQFVKRQSIQKLEKRIAYRQKYTDPLDIHLALR
jgi:allantoinase